MTTVVVTEEVITLLTTVEQGPPGIKGEPGFTVGVAVISGGIASTDYSDKYVFDGGSA